MGGCTACTKFVLATVNIITIMLGIVLAATGIVVIVKGHVYFPEVPKYRFVLFRLLIVKFDDSLIVYCLIYNT